MKVAIDIDDVLCESFKHYMKFAKSKGYKSIPYENINLYHLSKVLKITEKEAINIIDDFTKKTSSDSIELVDGAKEGVKFLANKFEIYFITARKIIFKKETLSLLKERFGINGSQLFFSGEENGQFKSKSQICSELGISYLVEDNIEHSLKYADEGLNILLLNKPWNKYGSHENIVRFNHWNEIINFFEGKNG